ncbi:MAG: norR 23 [Proteobacteria bacterium]|nr:norR 23 [Pseudomonadota bacterium]
MTKILMLSPMQNMAEQAAMIASDLGIDLHVEVTYDDASAIAAIEREPDVEVVVTRGGLVEGVKGIRNISVVAITMSMNELLGLLDKLAAQGVRKVAIVSRENLLDGAVGDFQIQGLNVCIRSCMDEAGIKATVAELVKRGFEAFIGCRMSCEAARLHGVITIYLESGNFSIRAALQEAERILHAREERQIQTAQLKAIIDNIEEGVVAISRDNTISFYNEPARHLCTNGDKQVNFQALLAPFYHRSGEQIATVNGNRIVARRIPLAMDAHNQGDIITFQEVSRIQASETRIRISAHQKGLYAKNSFDDIVAGSEVMQALIEKAKIYAGYDSNLLIHGETGTGKEIFAQSIHNHSRYKNGPFVSVNTASIAPTLLESELFGYVDGAFTGARKGGKAGLFELAHRGSIFLDEIGELTLDIQSRLLRVLQEKEIMRLGDDKIIPVDVRIICATNRNLFELARDGRFRQDLYYRIHVLSIRIPPLRARAEDIPLLFTHWLNQLRPEGSEPAQISEKAMKLLCSYDWPGNIRQIRNVAEVIACRGTARIDAALVADALDEQGQVDPFASAAQDADGIYMPEGITLKQMETLVIKHLMKKHSPESVCSKLGISRVTLWRKLNSAELNSVESD